MAIPTRFDGQLAEIDDLAGCVMIKLRTLRHAGMKQPDMGELRELLQRYVDLVINIAKDVR
jgi:hypothetical protein